MGAGFRTVYIFEVSVCPRLEFLFKLPFKFPSGFLQEFPYRFLKGLAKRVHILSGAFND